MIGGSARRGSSPRDAAPRAMAPGNDISRRASGRSPLKLVDGPAARSRNTPDPANPNRRQTPAPANESQRLVATKPPSARESGGRTRLGGDLIGPTFSLLNIASLANSAKNGDKVGIGLGAGQAITDTATYGSQFLGAATRKPAFDTLTRVGGAAGNLLAVGSGAYNLYTGISQIRSGDASGALPTTIGGSQVASGFAGLGAIGSEALGATGLSSTLSGASVGLGLIPPAAVGLGFSLAKGVESGYRARFGAAGKHAEVNLINDRNNTLRASQAFARNIVDADHVRSTFEKDGPQFGRVITNNPLNQLLQASPPDAFQSGVKPVNDWVDIESTGNNGGLLDIDLEQKGTSAGSDGLSFLGEGASRSYWLHSNGGIPEVFKRHRDSLYTERSAGQAAAWQPQLPDLRDRPRADLVYFSEQPLEGEAKYGQVPDAAMRTKDPAGYYNKALPRTEEERKFRENYFNTAGRDAPPNAAAVAELNKARGNPLVRTQQPLSSRISTSADAADTVVYNALLNPSTARLRNASDRLTLLHPPRADLKVEVPPEFAWQVDLPYDASHVATSIREQQPWRSGTWQLRGQGPEDASVPQASIEFTGPPAAFELLRHFE